MDGDGSSIIECPGCGRLCTEDDLSMCLTCGDQYCRCCDWSCACDDLVMEIDKELQKQPN